MASSRELELLHEALPNYEFGAELGRGAFGVVYLARHRELGREVAVKQLPRAFAADPSVRERFIAEAQMVAALDYPHIVPVYDFVNREDGMCLIIMERCHGAVSDRFTTDGLATDETCAALLACCAALDFAHGAGVLHRDIKPENLLFDAKGVVKLGDFGIARAVDANIRRTATGTVIGTPAYMSPEQVRGEDLTPASDVYSVGIMAYELLTGRFPFDESTSATGLLAHHLVTEPRPLIEAHHELPVGIGDVIDRSLSKDVADRQASAEEFAMELTAACVSSFGAGWLRRRRFVLHWPEIIAESERARDDGARTGTVIVKADDSRDLLAGHGGDATSPSASPAPAMVPPSEVPTVAGPAPGDAPAAAPQPAAAVDPAQFVDAAPGTEAPSAGAGDTAPGGTDNAKIFAIVGVIVLVLGAIAFLATRGGDDGDPEPVATADGEAELDPETDGDGTSEAPVGDDGATEGNDDAASVDPTPEVFEGPDFSAGTPGAVRRDPNETIVVDSPWAATPCPTEAERVACILPGGVAVDQETGEVFTGYEVFGFEPQLEPAGYHLHFYLDTAVDGDERKAGAETPGGGWKPWDGFLPFMSFGGENGRTGFTVDDIRAAGARNLCVLVADPDQNVIPDSGNCAPLAQVWDDNLVLEQVNRLNGLYAGGCEIDATVILPEGWVWADLVGADPAEVAARLRPADPSSLELLLADRIARGGVLYADGVPGEEAFRPNLNILRVEGDFTLGAGPAAVAPLIQQLGFEGFDTEKTFLGRTILTKIQQLDGFDLLEYVVPDFGYALVLGIAVPDAATWGETADAIAATLAGC